MKNYFLFLVILLLSISPVLAAEFDNVKSYNEDLKVVTITNGFGLGDVIGQAKLLSPQNKLVPRGYQEVARFEIWAYQDYNDALKQFTFEDMKNSRTKINRDYDLKVVTVENFTENVWDQICEFPDAPLNERNCHHEVIGSRIVEREVYTKVTPADLKKNERLTIAVFTDVQVGDHVDWIPLIYGVEVEEWAEWTEGLNAGLISYYKLDEQDTTGTGSITDERGNFTGTNVGADNATGKINTAYTFPSNSDLIDLNSQSFDTSDGTISFWFNSDDVTTEEFILADRSGSGDYLQVQTFANNLYFRIQSGGTSEIAGSTSISLGTWYHVVVTWGSNGMEMFLDNSSEGTNANTGSWTANTDMKLGGCDAFADARRFNGEIDEVGFWNRQLSLSEISDLWNNGTGISYTDSFGPTDNPPTVTLISPANDTTINTPTQIIQANVTDDQQVANVTLNINGAANQTNTSGINGSYSFTVNFNTGENNWSITGVDNASQSTESETRIITYTDLAPSLTLDSPVDNFNATSSQINFQITATDDQGIVNVTLNINGAANETNSSGINGSYSFTKSFSEGEHNWSAIACNVNGLCNQSETRTFNYTQVPVYIDLISPIDNFNTSSTNVNLTCFGYSDMGVEQLNLTIEGALNQSITNSTPSQNLTISSILGFTDGSYDWNCSTFIGESQVDSATRTFTVDTTAPIFTLAPTSQTIIVGQELGEFFEATDPLGIDTFTVNNTDFSINSTGFLTNATSLSIGNYSLLISVNDTLGNTNTTVYSLEVQPKSIIVSLDSPADGSSSGTNQITFNCSAQLLGDGNIENVSLFTNKTSIWSISDSKDSQKVLAYDDFTTSLSTNLTSYWKVDNNILTDSESSNDLTNGGSINTTGILNSGRLMDGVNDYLRIPSSAISAEISISIWFKANNPTGSTQYLYHGCSGSSSCSNGTIEIWTESGVINGRVRGETSYPNGTFTDTTKWHNVIYTYDGSQECLYLDGGFLGCSSVSPSRVTTGFKNFGGLETGIISSSFFNGSLDEMAIWDSALNLTQVNEVYLNRSIVNETFSFEINGSTLWNCYFCEEDGSCNFATSNYTIGLDAVAPTIAVTKPTGTISSGVVGLPEDYEVTFTDTNLDSCWYEYQGTNYSIDGCLSGITNASTFILQSGTLEMTFYANDTSGNLASNTTTWEYFINDMGISYTEPIYEGVTNTIIQTLSVAGGELIDDAWLDYNGTNYSVTITFGSGQYNLTATAPAPDVAATQNVSFRFYVDIDGTVYDLREAFQQVLPLNFSSCAGGDVLLNLSLFDEETKAPLNGTIEINADLVSKVTLSAVESIATEETGSNVLICLDPLNSSEFFYLDAEIRYTSTDHASEFYHIQRSEIESYPINISLFDLALNDSTEFEVTYQDDNLITVEGAIIQLMRKYISEDAFETVEAPLTSDGGKAIVHIDLNTNKYKAIVVKDGVVLDVFENLVFNCENELSGECTELLLGEIDPQNDVDVINLRDFSYSVSESNDTVTTTFSIPSGVPGAINVVLTQTDIFGNNSQCNQTIVSSSGSVDCTFDKTIGDSYLELTINKNGEMQGKQSYLVKEDDGTDFLENNYIIVIVFLLSLVGMAFSSPEWMLLNAVATIVIAGALWLLNGVDFVMGLGSIIWLVVAVGILIFKMSKQEDR